MVWFRYFRMRPGKPSEFVKWLMFGGMPAYTHDIIIVIS